MSQEEWDLLRERTRARSEATERVKRAVEQAAPRPGAVRAALSEIPVPDEHAAARVKQRILTQDPRPGSGRSIHPTAALLMGLTVLLGLVGALGGTAAIGPDLLPRDLLLTAPPPVTTTREAVVIDLDPGSTLTRDHRGTTVAGAAAARTLCRGPWVTRAPGRVTCAPVSAAGLLALAEAARDAGQPPAEVLRWLDRATLLVAPATVRAELQAARISTLHDAGRTEEALTLARAHVSDPRAPRRDEVARLGAALAIGRQDCRSAVPFLAILAPEAFDAAMALASCDPEQRQTALDQARRLARTPQERAAVAALASDDGETP